MSFQRNFQENLRYWIKSTGRRQDWLAEQLGVSAATVSLWLKGRSLPAAISPTYDRLANLMGLPSTACLFMEDGAKDPEAALRKLLKDIGADP